MFYKVVSVIDGNQRGAQADISYLVITGFLGNLMAPTS